ncbi:MAG: DUF4405 domain-containing protein [Candidatus Pacebacteria bacterium]|nr:DUF4405 domain-containing protein [Candidatus Paceibacterota bacterium]
MLKARINAFVNVLSFVFFLAVLISGVVLWLFLPGSRGIGQSVFLGLERHAWRSLHDWTGLVFAFLMAAHLILHGYWIKALPGFFRKKAQ